MVDQGRGRQTEQGTEGKEESRAADGEGNLSGSGEAAGFNLLYMCQKKKADPHYSREYWLGFLLANINFIVAPIVILFKYTYLIGLCKLPECVHDYKYRNK